LEKYAMRIISFATIVVLSSQLAIAAPPQNTVPENGPTPPTVDISVPQQDTRLVVVDFKIGEYFEGKEQSSATTKVAVPIGQTGELSIGNTIPGGDAGAGNQQFVGTRVFVTPMLRRDGRIQLTCKFRISQLVGQAAPGVAPKIDVREMSTNAVTNPGQAVAVSNFKIGDTETHIVATPRILSAAAAMKESAPVR
jgi:hypothetical protein